MSELNKCQSYCKQGTDLSKNKKYTKYTANFEFQEGEQLVGDVIIALNQNKKITRSKNDQGIGQMKFTTSQNRTFEAGNIEFYTKDESEIFDSHNSLLVGIFGSLKSNLVISSLGLIFFKFNSINISDIEWPDQSDLQLETQEIKGTTRNICNRTERIKHYTFEQPTAIGDQRCTWLNHPFLEKKQINKLINGGVKIPSVDQTGMKILEDVSKLPKDDRSFSKIRQNKNVNLISGQCAHLKYNTKVAKQDNLKFVFSNIFSQDSLNFISFKFSGQTSMEKTISKSVDEIVKVDDSINSDIEISPWFDYNLIKQNRKNEAQVGSKIGQDFSIQKENTIVSNITIVQNENQQIIRSIKLKFQGEDEEYSFPSIDKSNKINSDKRDISKSFQFAQNEYLVGRIIMSVNPGNSLSYIKFTTSLDRVQEAGIKNFYDNNQVFYANKNFMAGIFGKVTNQNQIASLGFIFYKDFVKQEHLALEWDSNNSQNIIIKEDVQFSKPKCVSEIEQSDNDSDHNNSNHSNVNDNDSQSQLSDLQDINNAEDKLKHEFTYRSVYGEDRQFVLDQGSFQKMNVNKPLSAPAINDEGEYEIKVIDKQEELEQNKMSKQQVRQTVEIPKKQCAKLKVIIKMATLEHQKFTISNSYLFENGQRYVANINGQLNVKKILFSKVETIQEESDANNALLSDYQE